jgi:hypothetical protein
MTIKTQIKAGGVDSQHSETLQVRWAIRAGRLSVDHGEYLHVRAGRRESGRSRQ